MAKPQRQGDPGIRQDDDEGWRGEAPGIGIGAKNKASEIDDLVERLARAWSAETSSTWTAAAPARGQCSVTAIAVQRLRGGEILKTPAPDGLHFYNRIDGRRYDFTAEQFARPIVYQDLPSDIGEAMGDTSPEQLEALLRRLGDQG